jgi:hypothetical protein
MNESESRQYNAIYIFIIFSAIIPFEIDYGLCLFNAIFNNNILAISRVNLIVEEAQNTLINTGSFYITGKMYHTSWYQVHLSKL